MPSTKRWSVPLGQDAGDREWDHRVNCWSSLAVSVCQLPEPMELHYCWTSYLISSSGYCSPAPHLQQNYGHLATPNHATNNLLCEWELASLLADLIPITLRTTYHTSSLRPRSPLIISAGGGEELHAACNGLEQWTAELEFNNNQRIWQW
jgi:hypothetical protein